MQLQKIFYYFIFLIGYLLIGIAAPFVYVGVSVYFFGIMGGSSSIGEKLLGVLLLGIYILVFILLSKAAYKKLRATEIKRVYFVGILIAITVVYVIFSYLEYKNDHPYPKKWELMIGNTTKYLKHNPLDEKYLFNSMDSLDFTSRTNRKIFNDKSDSIIYSFIVNDIEKIKRVDFDYLIYRLPKTGFQYVIIIESSKSDVVHKAVYAKYTSEKALRELGVVNANDEASKYKEINKVLLRP